MKRKIVKQGPSTLMVSLPKRWADRHAIKSGVEIEVEEINGFLMLKPERKKARVSMDVASYNALDEKAIKALEESGAEIEIKCDCSGIMKEKEAMIEGINAKSMVCQRCQKTFMTRMQEEEFRKIKKLNEEVKKIRMIMPKEISKKESKIEVVDSRSFRVYLE